MFDDWYRRNFQTEERQRLVYLGVGIACVILIVIACNLINYFNSPRQTVDAPKGVTQSYDDSTNQDIEPDIPMVDDSIEEDTYLQELTDENEQLHAELDALTEQTEKYSADDIEEWKLYSYNLEKALEEAQLIIDSSGIDYEIELPIPPEEGVTR